MTISHRQVLWALPLASACLASGYGMAIWHNRTTAPAASETAAVTSPTQSQAKPTEELPSEVTMTAEVAQSIGLTTVPALAGRSDERVWRTGRIALDEERVAHLSPPVDGVVRTVTARLGAEVSEGETLATLDCREVGQAKLDLVKARLLLTAARAQDEWTRTSARNTSDLLTALAKETPLPEIDAQFHDRQIGEWRQQLVTAYAQRLQAKNQLDAMLGLGAASVPEANLRRARTDHEAAEATYRGLSEELKFQVLQKERLSEQHLREAQANEDISEAQLLMLSYTHDEVTAMDPVAELGKVSHYPIRAPFKGTVVSKHAVLHERVGPSLLMFELADLSTVWVEADVFESDLPLVRSLPNREIAFRSLPADIPMRTATVFYTGDLIDEKSRSLKLIATAPNPDRQLKPGLFVEIGLPTQAGKERVEIPAAAVQRHESHAFVFVPSGEGRYRRKDITPGETREGRVEILSGLAVGDQVVAEGAFVLKSELLKSLMAGD
jgi:cobalt-zinc-cadmium efflux system membrane fusion protein